MCDIRITTNQYTGKYDAVCHTCFDGAPYHSVDNHEQYGSWFDEELTELEHLIQEHLTESR